MGEIVSFPARDREARPGVFATKNACRPVPDNGAAARFRILDHVVLPGGEHGTVERIELHPGGPLLFIRLHCGTGALAVASAGRVARPSQAVPA